MNHPVLWKLLIN